MIIVAGASSWMASSAPARANYSCFTTVCGETWRQGDFGRVGVYEHDVAHLIQQLGVEPERLIEDIRGEVLPSDFEQMRAIIGELRDRLTRFDERRE